jgi:uncharacterized membrane protein HdeD (DUF308 family)
MKKNIGRSFLSLGIVFLLVGLVQQNFTLSFTSGAFNIGVIFCLSGIVSILLEKKSQKAGN